MSFDTVIQGKGWASLFAAVLVLLTLPVQAQDPWLTLTQVRQALEKTGATTADFVQKFQPAGFDSGDEERGRISLRYPECLRWDYEDPFPKTLVLCGDQVHAWAPEDSAGRRYQVDPSQEPGLDLLLLATDELRQRYQAEARDGAPGLREIRLQPLAAEAGLKSATLTVDTASLRLVALAYEDIEGGKTVFEISGYRPMDEAEAFTPPANLEWSDN
jgi:outer membrane lipoprotein-sorting protein